MQITQVQVGNLLYPLAEGQPLPFAVGETIRVFYTFKYKMPKTGDVRVWTSLYNYSPGYLDRKEAAQTKQVITLEKALDWKDYAGEIDIVIGQVSAGIYGLICELPDYGAEAEHHIDNCIEVTAPPSVFEMIGPLLVLGLMMGMVAMMAPMMEEGFG